MLSHLDLSYNFDPDTGVKFLQLKNPSFKTLVSNFSRLELLFLSHTNISSEVPDLLTNFTSLWWLALRDCELYGDFPTKLFHLPNLRVLSVRFNENLSGHFPEFHERSTLIELRLAFTGFSGRLPSSIDKLESLEMLDISGCNFSGAFPHSLSKLAKITYLGLQGNNFIGHIPSSFQNLTQLTSLDLGQNKITGSIPPWLGNLTKINVLQLALNKLEGTIPRSVSKLVNLEILDLSDNNLSGVLEFHMFLNMKSLTYLQLNGNNLSLVFGKTNTNATRSKFQLLGLSSCNLFEFPNFLGHQNELELVDLGANKIHGQVPKWMLNTSVDTLISLNIGDNFLTGFNQQLTVLPWVNLRLFDLSYNMLQGPLPIPPPSIVRYDVSNNMLTGEVSHLFCNMSSVYQFQLSNNNLSGVIPHCLGNLRTSLSVLDLSHNTLHGSIPLCLGDLSFFSVMDLRMNMFDGTIPTTFSKCNSLRNIGLYGNRLKGSLPPALLNCGNLEILDLGNNMINDNFPQWLESLPNLQVLILRSNKFHGSISSPNVRFPFQKLRIMDLSNNQFDGLLPRQYFQNFLAMMHDGHVDKLKYMGEEQLSSDYEYLDLVRVFTIRKKNFRG